MTFRDWASHVGFAHLKMVAPIKPAPILVTTPEFATRIGKTGLTRVVRSAEPVQERALHISGKPWWT